MTDEQDYTRTGEATTIKIRSPGSMRAPNCGNCRYLFVSENKARKHKKERRKWNYFCGLRKGKAPSGSLYAKTKLNNVCGKWQRGEPVARASKINAADQEQENVKIQVKIKESK